MCDRSRVHCPDSSPGTAGSGPPPNHVVAAAVSGRRVSIMETNINEPNTTYSADKVLLDRFNQPIKYEGNPAALAGLAEDIVDALKRQRLFFPLFANRAVAKPDGKMLVADRDSALFVNGTYDDGEKYGYDKPCPASVKRIETYTAYRTAQFTELESDAARTAFQASTPAFTSRQLDADERKETIVQEHFVLMELQRLADVIKLCFKDFPTHFTRFFRDCENDGIAILQKLPTVQYTEEESAIAINAASNFILTGAPPLLNNDTFDDWTRDFEKTQRRVPPALRVIASDTAKIQRIDHLFVTPDISNDWRTHIRVERYIKKESGEVVSYEWYVEQLSLIHI